MAKQKPNKSQNNPVPTVSNPKKQAISEAKSSSPSSSLFDGWLPIVAILIVTFFALFKHSKAIL